MSFTSNNKSPTTQVSGLRVGVWVLKAWLTQVPSATASTSKGMKKLHVMERLPDPQGMQESSQHRFAVQHGVWGCMAVSWKSVLAV